MSYKIQRPRRISSESVPEESRAAVDVIGSSVNNFMEEVYDATMGNLGPTNNLNMEIKDLDVNVNSNGIPNVTLEFKSNIKSKVLGITVIRAFNSTVTSAPFVTFSENRGIVSITHISGLTADTDYTLRILTIGS